VQEVRVFRNDEITLQEIAALKPDQLVLSPGPCSPAEAGICVEAIRHFAGKLPILGVCLGHQASARRWAAGRARAGADAWQGQHAHHRRWPGGLPGLPQRFSVIRYHSLAIERATLPA
jgi:anthranilate synthase component 2